MFDVTPLENLFIEEYMLRAPGDFVKVYIYGLRLCYHPVEDATVPAISRALGLEEKTVLDAFAYWERVGVLRRIADNPPAYSFFNLKEAMLTGKAEGDIPKADRDFNIALQDLFGTRLLQAQDYERVYKIMEEMGFAPEVVLMLVKHCIERSGKGTAVTFASIEKEAARWAKKGATTLRTAEDYLRTLSASYEGAQKVLRQLGLRRAPTVAEEALYTKWTREWGFSLEAILYSCGETTKISQPNFAYLDKVLENRHKKQLNTSAEMASAQQARVDVMRPVREVLDALGVKGVSPTEDLAMVYAAWLKMGFSHEAVLRAARYTLRQGSSRFEDVGVRLQAWARQALYTPEAIDAFLARRRQDAQTLRAVFEAAGIGRQPAAADFRLAEQWRLKGYRTDVLLVAAEGAPQRRGPHALYRPRREQLGRARRRDARGRAGRARAVGRGPAPARRRARPGRAAARCAVPPLQGGGRAPVHPARLYRRGAGRAAVHGPGRPEAVRRGRAWTSFRARQSFGTCWRNTARTRRRPSGRPTACARASPRRSRSMRT